MTTPAAIRAIFSRNLRQMIGDRPVAQVAREIGIHRNQLNRYLYGESWPRPDVLVRITDVLGGDARILTTPLAEIDPAA